MQALCPNCNAAIELNSNSDTILSCPACGHPVPPPVRPTLPGQETITDPNQTVTGPDDEAPRQLGRYRVDHLLGSGAFGAVYKGYDEELHREVAIKVPHRHRLTSPEQAEAYLEEARILARLDHHGIVPVYDVGRTDDGLCYVVSKFIEGTDLAARIRQGRVPPEEAASLVFRVADALAHAHERGLVHRDVKPANILLDAAGTPYVSDFGLALTEEKFAQGPSFAGTPAYMSPEQARSEGHRVDGRTDIYSLGVVFYEMLTGRQPFQGENLTELLEQITGRNPLPPRQLEDKVPEELERICLKCLSKRATDRYGNAKELVEDIRHWQWRGERERRAQQREDDPTQGKAPEPRVVPKGLRAFDASDADFFLTLLPGPRDRDGLPATLSFWKSRIESADPGATFSVGLVYGPSGCGKSSLIRAGLIPRLDPKVTAVYAEATRDNLELKLLQAVKRVCPALAPEPDLASAIAAVRRGQGLSAGRKLLIVIDQFEQCLHVQHDRPLTGLVSALRQADGARVQFLMLVRDDFWLAASRLFADLEVPLVEGQNLQLIDLFDPDHARHVLQLFGQAFRCLPERATDMTREQNQFLDQAVQELSEGGKVISVRLSLFAEMMKGRPWTPESLASVGGTQGVGVTFLEETFNAKNASPERRALAKEARAVLQALLPEAGSDIKGRVRSQPDLMKASGLEAQPRRFDRLLQMLDRELRIITPTEMAVDPALTPGAGSALYYQLTHDFLVPALRDWLTQKQRETWRGRAELRLQERTAQWIRGNQQPRFLPSFAEFLTIGFGVPYRKRRPEERALMSAARTYYGFLGGILLLAAVCLGVVGWDWNGRTQGKRLAQAIEAAEPEDAIHLIEDELPRYRRWADPLLRRVANNDRADPGQRLRACLALVQRDQHDEHHITHLKSQLFVCDGAEFSVVCKALHPFEDPESLVQIMRDPERPRQERLRAGRALVVYEWDHWKPEDANFVVDCLVSSGGDDPRDVRKDLRGIAELLLDPLKSRFHDASARVTVRTAAAEALADFLKDHPGMLAELACSAIPEQYEVLYPLLMKTTGAEREEVKGTLLGKLSPLAPEVTDERARIESGITRAGAAITLLHLGERKGLWSILEGREDSEAMTQLVHRLRDRHVSPTVLLACLDAVSEPQSRFALLLGLGEFRWEQIPEARREPLKERLVGWYRSDPSAAMHGACGWLLRKWGMGEEADRVDHTPLPYDNTRTREWFVEVIGGEGFTFIVFPPGEYTVGSPNDEGYRQKNEKQRKVKITRPFAVTDRELTRGQYEKFRPLKSGELDDASPTARHPVGRVNWLEAVAYCLWLTKQANLSADEQAYERPPGGDEGKDETLQAAKFRPDRVGFRLPTEAEWEIACRAGTVTAYGFGSDRELLRYYGRHLDMKADVVGSLRPNLRGMFDMHGNVWEWCQDWYQTQPKEEADPAGPAEGKNRVSRGGGWDRSPWHCRSAYRHSPTPDYRATYNGFRLAKTLPGS